MTPTADHKPLLERIDEAIKIAEDNMNWQGVVFLQEVLTEARTALEPKKIEPGELEESYQSAIMGLMQIFNFSHLDVFPAIKVMGILHDELGRRNWLPYPKNQPSKSDMYEVTRIIDGKACRDVQYFSLEAGNHWYYDLFEAESDSEDIRDEQIIAFTYMSAPYTPPKESSDAQE